MSTARGRKLATILFADLVGSTELRGALDPEYTRDLLDRFYDSMEATWSPSRCARSGSSGTIRLIGQAVERFEAIGLDWHAEKTRERARG